MYFDRINLRKLSRMKKMLCYPSKIATATADFSRKRQKKKRIRDVAILSLTPEKNQQISETILFIEVQILACTKF